MRQKRPAQLPKLLFVFGFLSFFNSHIIAQTINVGSGSYSTTLPAGAIGPSYSNGQPAVPKVSDSFDQLIKTNDFWSSLIFPFFGNQYSNNIYAHPLNMKAINTGLILGYSPAHMLIAEDYLFPFANHLTVSVSGLNASETLTDEYGDWTVKAVWEGESSSLEATFGHGLPYTFFRKTGGNAIIFTNSAPNVWYNQNEVLGVTINGVHYGIFAPSGSVWTGSSTFESSLNGKDYFSVAVLPDNDPVTLEYYRKHAYAFVTNSAVEWNYDEETALLETTYSYSTELLDSAEGNSDQTLSALYRHQWLFTDNPLTNHSYNSPRGLMKVHEGNTFSTNLLFSGILPSLPDLGDYDRVKLTQFVQQVANETLGTGPTYENGKAMARFANLVPIADQLGLTTERDHFISEMKKRLEDWFTVGGPSEYSFNSTWNSLTGYPSGFGADNQINDHHFHASYAVYTAATIAMYDSVWASQENWGGMVNLLIKDSNNWDRNDTQFPFLRNHDEYAGHSWASGHADFADGNNQESSSESMNFSAAAFLWGEITGQTEIRDLGIYLYTTEESAIAQYWFDVDNEVFPSNYPKKALGIVWGSKGVHSTWFGNNPEFIHGINFLPIISASVYLGKYPDYVLENYNEIISELGGQQPTIWKDIFWSYLAFNNPDLAISSYQADPNYTPFDGLSRAHTLHWLYNLKKMGRFNDGITADIPTYAVFVKNDIDTTYIAYNSKSEERVVTFSDGFRFSVAPKQMATFMTDNGSEVVFGPAPDPTKKDENVISIFSDSYTDVAGTNFNPSWQQQTQTSIVQVDGNETLLYQNLNYQGTEFSSNIDVSDMDSVHFDYWTSDATYLEFFLISPGPQETSFAVDLKYNKWESVDIPLTEFDDVVNLNEVFQLKVEGTGTVYLDNIYFFKEGMSVSSEDEIFELPSGIKLAQNYPNPFNPSTNIEFSIPNATEVSLKIYNSLGQVSATLINSRLNPGEYNIIWNASNSPSGIYFYQLKTGNTVLTKRMILIK